MPYIIPRLLIITDALRKLHILYFEVNFHKKKQSLHVISTDGGIDDLILKFIYLISVGCSICEKLGDRCQL